MTSTRGVEDGAARPSNAHTLPDAAVTYAKCGWPVLPMQTVGENGGCSCGLAECSSPGKHPVGHLVRHGVHDASANADQVAGWWRARPDANIGLATGGPGGVVALDVDAGKGGLEELRRLEAEHGALPITARSRTGGGGLHLLFRNPDGHGPVRNSVCGLGPGIDVRGDGGCIVLPPSRHASGAAYAWEVAPSGLGSTRSKRSWPNSRAGSRHPHRHLPGAGG